MPSKEKVATADGLFVKYFPRFVVCRQDSICLL